MLAVAPRHVTTSEQQHMCARQEGEAQEAQEEQDLVLEQFLSVQLKRTESTPTPTPTPTPCLGVEIS